MLTQKLSYSASRKRSKTKNNELTYLKLGIQSLDEMPNASAFQKIC